MPWALYLSPQIGSGADGDYGTAFADNAGPYRARLRKYVGGGSYGQVLDLPGRRVCLCCVRATAAEHAAITADAAIVRLHPDTAADLPALVALLDTPFTSIGTASWRSATKARVEAMGINTAFLTAADTLRAILRAIIKWCYLSAKYESNAAFQEFIAAALTATVSSLSVGCRNAISAWFDAHGLDRSWIVGTTTVRAVQSYIATNATFPRAIFAGGEN
jgi:hypothetical protein